MAISRRRATQMQNVRSLPLRTQSYQSCCRCFKLWVGQDSSVGKSPGLVIRGSRVRFPAGAAGRIFISRVQCLYRLLFGVRSIPVLPQWQVKDPGHSAKRAGGRLHLNTPTSLTHRSRSGLTLLSRHSVETYHGNELTRNSSGSVCPQSFELAEPLWTDPDVRVELVRSSWSPPKYRMK